MKSSSQIATFESARIAKRLFNHWKHKFEVKESEQQFEIIMPEAQVSLIPQTEYLAVEITAAAEKLDHLPLDLLFLYHVPHPMTCVR